MAREKGRKYVWTHGVDTHIEYPDRVHDGGAEYPASGLPRRAGFGMVVRQEAGTSNWFHLAIPSEIFFNTRHWWGFGFNAHHKLEDVYLTANLNENAVINHVHVWDGAERIAAFDGEESLGLDMRGPDVSERFDVRDRRCEHGIVVCVRVDFLSGEPMGQVTFIGARMRLYKD